MATSANLALAGFMGTGKSTVGRLVAARLGMPFVDTDAEIEAAAGASIPALFARSEALFRKYESVVCLQAALGSGQVLALGGGALLNPAARAALEAGALIVCLDASLDEIMRRVGDDPARPLFGDRAAVERLLEARAAHYASLPHHVETTGRALSAVAEEVIALWNRHSA